MENDEDFKKAVLDANTNKGNILQSELDKKSVIGLFVIAFLLIFCGYEQSVNDSCSNSLSHLQLALLCSSVYFLLFFFVLHRVLFRKWKWTVIFIASILGVFFYVFIYMMDINIKADIDVSGIKHFIGTHLGLIVCIIVSIPILWQIFITWICKSVFYGYIKTEIRKAQEDYKKVQLYIETNQYGKLPQRYYEIYMRISQSDSMISTQQALGDSLLEYRGVLYNDIRTIGLKVRIHQLLISWIKYKILLLYQWAVNLVSSKGKSVTEPNKLNVESYADYARRFMAMKKKNKRLKLKDFCVNNKIDFKEFKNYYCKYCQLKQT